MNELITKILQAIESDYDEGVVEYKYYPVTELHEINCEDMYTTMHLLDDVSAYIREVTENLEEGTLDLHCIFQKRISRIYIHYSK